MTTVMKTDVAGRLLCPRCGAGLYLEVLERHTGIPAHEDAAGQLEYNTLDASDSAYESEFLYCIACGWHEQQSRRFHCSYCATTFDAAEAAWDQLGPLCPQCGRGEDVDEIEDTTPADDAAAEELPW